MRISNIKEWKKLRPSLCGKSIGFVPTMGNLHNGHGSLIQRSAEENDITVVSIFINPTQFNNKEDFLNYPKTLAEDITFAQKLGANYIFTPEYNDIYPDKYTYKVVESKLSDIMEGQHRPGHFEGMLTIVLKLLILISPTKAYFGEKDYQQLSLIKGMIDAFFLDIELIACPTIRDQSGLALSSRNSKLSPENLKKAHHLHRLLSSNESLEKIKESLEALDWKVDYVEDYENRRYAAAYLSEVRLIDNIPINPEI